LFKSESRSSGFDENKCMDATLYLFTVSQYKKKVNQIYCALFIDLSVLQAGK